MYKVNNCCEIIPLSAYINHISWHVVTKPCKSLQGSSQGGDGSAPKKVEEFTSVVYAATDLAFIVLTYLSCFSEEGLQRKHHEELVQKVHLQGGDGSDVSKHFRTSSLITTTVKPFMTTNISYTDENRSRLQTDGHCIKRHSPSNADGAVARESGLLPHITFCISVITQNQQQLTLKSLETHPATRIQRK
jgi:hypothetical protein